MNKKDILKNGLFRSNPIFVLLLGLCSTLAITYSVDNAIGMGASVIIVLVLSNTIISLIRKFIPSQIRIPVYIIIIATLVSIIIFLMEAFAYDIFVSLGIFLPLITVNCIIFGRAEAFASKNSVLDSAVDGLAMGGGFFLSLILISVIREILGTGHLIISNPFDTSQKLFSTQAIFNYLGGIINPSNGSFISDFFSQYSIKLFTQPVGAFLVLAFLIAYANYLVEKKKIRKESEGVSK